MSEIGGVCFLLVVELMMGKSPGAKPLLVFYQ